MMASIEDAGRIIGVCLFVYLFGRILDWVFIILGDSYDDPEV